MKPFISLILLSASIANTKPINAEEQSAEISEEPTSSVVAEASSEEASQDNQEPSSEPNTPSDEQDQDPTFDEFKTEVEEWLAQYLEKDLLTQIISWAVDVGVLGGLFTVYLKYRKYKNKTIGQLVDEIKAKVTETMESDFKNLSKEQQEKLINGLETLKKSNELVIKALVLAQSKTTDSKLALLDLVSESNTSVEVKEAVEEVRKEVEANEEQKQKVQEAVKDEYNPID